MFDFFSSEPQPDIEFLGVTINEPMTAFTGILITGYAVFLCYHMRALPWSHSLLRWMIAFFVFLGLSNLFGSILGHAYQSRVGLIGKTPGWLLGMLGVYSISRAALTRWDNNTNSVTYRSIIVANGVLLVGLYGLAVSQLQFKYVEFYTGIGSVGLMLVPEYLNFKRARNEVSRWMMRAILPMLLAAILHIVKFSISKWLNYFDLGHLCICISAWCFYRATVAQAAILSGNVSLRDNLGQ